MTFMEELRNALHERGDPMAPAEFLGVLRDITGTTDEPPLTEKEKACLIESGEVTEDDLTEDSLAEATARWSVDRVAAEREVVANSLTVGEAARLLDREEDDVRCSCACGDLYAPDLPRYPRWQFAAGRVVPGLRDVIPAFPRGMHPLAIEGFMLNPNVDLDGRTPVEWLTRSGDINEVVDLAESLAYY